MIDTRMRVDPIVEHGHMARMRQRPESMCSGIYPHAAYRAHACARRDRRADRCLAPGQRGRKAQTGTQHRSLQEQQVTRRATLKQQLHCALTTERCAALAVESRVEWVLVHHRRWANVLEVGWARCVWPRMTCERRELRRRSRRRCNSLPCPEMRVRRRRSVGTHERCCSSPRAQELLWDAAATLRRGGLRCRNAAASATLVGSLGVELPQHLPPLLIHHVWGDFPLSPW